MKLLKLLKSQDVYLIFASVASASNSERVKQCKVARKECVTDFMLLGRSSSETSRAEGNKRCRGTCCCCHSTPEGGFSDSDCKFFCCSSSVAAVSGAEDVALYVGMVAVALCLTLLLIVVVLVYRRKKEGLDADVADSSILTTGFQPMGIKPSKPGVWAPRPRRPPPHSSRTLFFVLPSSVHLPVCPSAHRDRAALIYMYH